MSGAQYRLLRFIERCGEAITVGAGSTKGIVTLMHPDAARKYLTDAEVEAANRPIRAIVLLHDDSIIATTAITVNGENLTVVKVVDRRVRGVTLYKLAIAY
ncbi:MAG: hypothetical protein M3R13_03160 [Armatimonadota bacterium]|nr:hypothetical protein [Armatimonadota bacterium]